MVSIGRAGQTADRRIDAEGALSVQTITKQEIARIGAPSTEALLQTISALSSMGGTVNATGAGSSTYGNSTLSLRGLDSSRTLVLVNGRRLANFADGSTAVNVNSIPLAAIDRIEVLKDGASSIYGGSWLEGGGAVHAENEALRSFSEASGASCWSCCSARRDCSAAEPAAAERHRSGHDVPVQGTGRPGSRPFAAS